MLEAGFQLFLSVTATLALVIAAFRIIDRYDGD